MTVDADSPRWTARNRIGGPRLAADGIRTHEGQWFGAGAEVLGLAGEVDPDDFQAVVMDATDPRSGERLRRQVGDRPVQGMDMTFSAPKSASLLFFLGHERTAAAVRQAHDEAVAAALGYMEREACVDYEQRCEPDNGEPVFP